MNKTTFMPSTIKAFGYTAESRPDGRWNVRGRGQRRVVTHQELHVLMSPRPKRQGAK